MPYAITNSPRLYIILVIHLMARIRYILGLLDSVVPSGFVSTEHYQHPVYNALHLSKSDLHVHLAHLVLLSRFVPSPISLDSRCGYSFAHPGSQSVRLLLVFCSNGFDGRDPHVQAVVYYIHLYKGTNSGESEWRNVKITKFGYCGAEVQVDVTVPARSCPFLLLILKRDRAREKAKDQVGAVRVLSYAYVDRFPHRLPPPTSPRLLIIDQLLPLLRLVRHSLLIPRQSLLDTLQSLS
jgi:hypothetical protein